MAEAFVKIDGINYRTLFERPSNGSSDGPVALLVHALMSNLHMWDSTVEALHRAGYSTLRVDHVGHNQTSNPEDEARAYHMDDITRHLQHLVRERTGRETIDVVIGCSIGGVLALRYAMLDPHGVSRVISVSAPGIESPPEAHDMWAQRIQLFTRDRANGSEELCQQTVKRWIPGERPTDDRARAQALDQVRTCRLEGYKLLADTIRNYHYEQDLSKIRKESCLIVVGTEDPASSVERMRRVAEQVDGAEFVTMQETGHLPPLQKPEQFEQIILSFLNA